MYCPEQYFTPKMLEEAFYKSLSRKGVRDIVFQSLQLKASEINDVHLEEILRLSATIFLHDFIKSNSEHLRACDVSGPTVVRVDPWLAINGETQVTTLPLNRLHCDKLRKQVAKGFVALDQELWVIDTSIIEEAARKAAIHARIAKLTKNFDGFSVCFPSKIYPSDVGDAMNQIAAKMLLLGATVPITQRRGRGRPTKVEDVAQYIDQNWPNGTDGLNRGVMLREIEKGLNIPVSKTTLSNALKIQIAQ